MSVIFTFGARSNTRSTTPVSYTLNNQLYSVSVWFTGCDGTELTKVSGAVPLSGWLRDSDSHLPVTVYQDLEERDSDIQTGDLRAIVLDDSSVSEFSAYYDYDHNTTTWTKAGNLNGLSPTMLGPLYKELRVERLLVDPIHSQAEKNTLYIVKGSNGEAKIFASGSTHNCTSTNDIHSIITNDEIDSKLEDVASGDVIIYTDIANRDAATQTKNTLSLVLDASSDATVSSGAATYLYRHSDTSWTKISEHANLDVSADWGIIVDAPTSLGVDIDLMVTNDHTHTESVIDIDTAVSQKHTHGNSSELDGFSDINGYLAHDGVVINPGVVTDDW